MSEHEAVLLQQFTRTRDAEAFSEITRRYAGLVYSTCLRVTGDAECARDATQDTFFQLLKHTGRVSGSLGGWLHQVATRRAVDLIRSDSARRRREQMFAAGNIQETDAWGEVSPFVDEAMTEIEPVQRDLLLRHFLQGETTVQMAAAEGVSQPTMSRRVETALEQLRERLRKKGVGVAAGILGAMMAGTSQEAPAMVLAELGKMALVSSSAVAAGTTTATLFGLNAKLAVATAVAVAGVGGYVTYKVTRPVESSPPAMGATQPAVPSTSTTTPASIAADAGTFPAVAPASTPTAVETPAPISSVRAGGGAQPPMVGAMATRDGGWVPYGGAVVVAGAGGQPIGFGGGSASRVTTDPATPEGAVNRLVAAAMRGDPTRLSPYLEGASDTNAVRQILENPRNEEERALQQALYSLVPPVEVLGSTALEDGLRLKFRATVRKAFALDQSGATNSWQPGDWFELEFRLKQVGPEWKIAGF